MENEDQYYQLPESSDDSIRRMYFGLVIFFIVLISVIAVVVINAQKIAEEIPFSAEKKFVRPYEEAIRKWYPGKSNAVVDHYLQSLADQLSEKISLPEGVEIDVHYVDVEEVNAFATLGGHIFVFKGLIEHVPDENSLSMVLAHEIAHIKNRDPMAAMGRGFAIQMLYGFITSDYSNSVDLISASGEVGMSFFSREQETKADEVALTALNKHYGHVSGHDDFFKTMQKEYKDEDVASAPEWMSSHPDLGKRVENLNKIVGDFEYTFGERKPIPQHILETIN